MTTAVSALTTTFVLASPVQAHAPVARVAAPTTTRHYITNLDGETRPAGLGYNLFDTGPSVTQITSLPRGVRALVWLGQKCPTRADAAFKRTIQRLASRPRVYGYYLSDEPHIASCPGGPAALASRARYIRWASQGRQKSFIVLENGADFRAFRPDVTWVDYVGVDPYPCSVSTPTCSLAKIDRRVNAALAAGIPRSRLVPVYQAFGQSRTDEHYYNLPTATQMQAMLARWRKLVPTPPFDYTYSWGHQSSSNPTLRDSAALQRVFADAF